MTDVRDLRDTVIPKSDQLNADDLLSGPMTVQIAAVSPGSKEQPVVIRIDGMRPYKPNKSMRRVLLALWGEDGHVWVGRLLTLYRDPEVKYGGVKLGGIKISHMSDIDKPVEIMLTVTRGRREPHRVDPIARDAAPAGGDSDKDERRAVLKELSELNKTGSEVKNACNTLGIDLSEIKKQDLATLHRIAATAGLSGYGEQTNDDDPFA